MTEVQVKIANLGIELAELIYNQLIKQLTKDQCTIYEIIRKVHRRNLRPTFYTQGFAMKILLYKTYFLYKKIRSCICLARQLHSRTSKTMQNPAIFINKMKNFRNLVAQMTVLTLHLKQVKFKHFIY
jgi:hypothetical protein